MPISQSFGSVPQYKKERPKSSNMHAMKSGGHTKDDLPGCTFK